MMNLPPTYRHDYGYEPPRPARVYDIPQIVERRTRLGRLRSVLLRAQRSFASPSRRQSAQPTIEKPRTGVAQSTAASQRPRTSAP